MKRYIIITSIHDENEVMRRYASLPGWTLVLVGDRKGPVRIADERIVFLDVERQRELGFTLHAHCRYDHYARKNLGYLYAMSQGAEVIAESDDDNLPKSGWGSDVVFDPERLKVFDGGRFFNAYAEFTKGHVWPRGYPLAEVLTPNGARAGWRRARVGVWQQLADGSPDVDAIYRLTSDSPVERFDNAESFALERGLYCPFNSQNTFWHRAAFPLLYLPMSVTFRFTDILRGYVAQRILWDMGRLLGFGSATVTQDRNVHDLMQDFREEIPMYRDVVAIADLLDAERLPASPVNALVQAYEALVREGYVGSGEIEALQAWQADLRVLGFE